MKCCYTHYLISQINFRTFFSEDSICLYSSDGCSGNPNDHLLVCSWDLGLSNIVAPGGSIFGVGNRVSARIDGQTTCHAENSCRGRPVNHLPFEKQWTSTIRRCEPKTSTPRWRPPKCRRDRSRCSGRPSRSLKTLAWIAEIRWRVRVQQIVAGKRESGVEKSGFTCISKCFCTCPSACASQSSWRWGQLLLGGLAAYGRVRHGPAGGHQSSGDTCDSVGGCSFFCRKPDSSFTVKLDYCFFLYIRAGGGGGFHSD